MLAAGEGRGQVSTDANGQWAGAAWAPPEHVTAEQETALRSDLAALESTLASGCDESWAHDRLAELAAVTATRSDVTEQEYGYKLRVMAYELSAYPASVVEAATSRYPRECKWFPELADILAYADAELQPLKRDRARIERCLHRRQHQRPRRGWQPPSPAEKDRARELVAGLKQQLAEQDAAERATNRGSRLKAGPARRGLPEGPGSRAARGESYSVLSSVRDDNQEASDD